LPKVEGNLVSINESERTFTLQYTAEEDDKKVLKKLVLKVMDDYLWDIVKVINRLNVKVEYKEGEPYSVARKISGEAMFILYGCSKDIKNKLKDYGSFTRYTYLAFGPIAAIGETGFAGGFGDADLILFAIILTPILLLGIYYLILVPLLIFILSLFTLGESLRMLKRCIFNMKISSDDPELNSRFKQILSLVLRNKSVIDGVPKRLIAQEIAPYHNKLIGVHKLFWRGMVLQAIAIIILGIFLGLQKFAYLSIPVNTLTIELALGGLFLIGFLLSIYSCWHRKFFEPPKLFSY